MYSFSLLRGEKDVYEVGRGDFAPQGTFGAI